jgi:hypothetical protein
MIRLFLIELLLFLTPSLLFIGYLLVKKRDPRHPVHWNGKGLRLFLVGLVLAGLFFVYEGLVSERQQGVYVPAHTENGVLVPGRFQ